MKIWWSIKKFQNIMNMIVDTIDTTGSSFFDIVFFFFNIETKPNQRIWQNTEEKLIYCTHCHTMSKVIWFHYFIIVNSQLRFYYVKLPETPEEISSSLGIYKSGCRLKWWGWRYLWTRQSFSVAFNTFTNQWCVKEGKNTFKLAYAFPKISEMLETHAHKKFNFQHFKSCLKKLRN